MEETEYIDLLRRVKQDTPPNVEAEMSAKRASCMETITAMESLMAALEQSKSDAIDLEAIAREAEEAERKKRTDGGCAEAVKNAVSIFKATVNGAITVWLYVADLATDIQVTLLFYNCGAMMFAAVSAFLLVAQFAVVWIRVLPYLHDTYGGSSLFYQSFLWLGMPFGMLAFDFLMLLEPFGLLPITPLPENLKQFVPAYKATRIIAEVLVEALPQCIIQGIILLLVSKHVRDGTATETELTLAYSSNGAFLLLLPKSITISSLTMLKTWYELVQEAREAGISVAKKGLQLWNVGSGLPLDAIKKGTIFFWKCQRDISDLEVVSLVDALSKNDSLTSLDLSLCQLEWRPPIANKVRSAKCDLRWCYPCDHAQVSTLALTLSCLGC